MAPVLFLAQPHRPYTVPQPHCAGTAQERGQSGVENVPLLVVPMAAFRSQFPYDLPTFAASPAPDPCPAAALSHAGLCRQLCSRVCQGLGKEQGWAGLSVPQKQPLAQQEGGDGLTVRLTHKPKVTSKCWKWPMRDAGGDEDPEPPSVSVRGTRGTNCPPPLLCTCMSSLFSTSPVPAPQTPGVSPGPAWSHTTSSTQIFFSPGHFPAHHSSP